MAVFPVVLDSCVLYPMVMRDTLLRAAEAGLYRVHWCQEILDGATRNLVKNKRMTEAQATYLEGQMKFAFPDATIEVPDILLPCMDNDIGDRHVLAAALVAKASVIVTYNIQDFPESSLGKFYIQAQTPDTFLTHLYDLFPEPMIQVLHNQVNGLRNPITLEELLQRLNHSSPTFVSRIEAALSS